MFKRRITWWRSLNTGSRGLDASMMVGSSYSSSHRSPISGGQSAHISCRHACFSYAYLHLSRSMWSCPRALLVVSFGGVQSCMSNSWSLQHCRTFIVLGSLNRIPSCAQSARALMFPCRRDVETIASVWVMHKLAGEKRPTPSPQPR